MEAKTSLINDENIDVTERVNNGFTKVFDTYREAYTYAQSKGGYVYEIRLKKEFNHKLITYKFFGYGVPK